MPNAVIEAVVFDIGCERVVSKLLLEFFAARKLALANELQGLSIGSSIILFRRAGGGAGQPKQGEQSEKTRQMTDAVYDGLTFTYVDGQHITGGTVHDAIGRRSQESGQTTAGMTANDNQISVTFFSNPMDFALRSAKDQMLVIFGHAKLFAKFGQMNFGLVLNLILHRREVHGDIASVG